MSRSRHSRKPRRPSDRYLMRPGWRTCSLCYRAHAHGRKTKCNYHTESQTTHGNVTLGWRAVESVAISVTFSGSEVTFSASEETSWFG